MEYMHCRDRFYSLEFGDQNREFEPKRLVNIKANQFAINSANLYKNRFGFWTKTLKAPLHRRVFGFINIFLRDR